jgi:hypothetical protein
LSDWSRAGLRIDTTKLLAPSGDGTADRRGRQYERGQSDSCYLESTVRPLGVFLIAASLIVALGMGLASCLYAGASMVLAEPPPPVFQLPLGSVGKPIRGETPTFGADLPPGVYLVDVQGTTEAPCHPVVRVPGEPPREERGHHVCILHGLARAGERWAIEAEYDGPDAGSVSLRREVDLLPSFAWTRAPLGLCAVALCGGLALLAAARRQASA